ncbi:MAG: hypothetical protein OQK58_13035 [Gammaproteobacteria bacterium]|nr:hypothetical protein [Gammaproteobacteria bacterium]
MDFVDKVFIKLSDDSERSAVLNESALKNILSTAYDVDRLPVSGPYAAVYEEFVFGYADLAVSHGEGKLSNYNNNEYTDIAFKLSDVSVNDNVYSDVLWRGSVIAHSAPVDAFIEQVKFGWKNLSRIDANIISSLGSLPADTTTLEAHRKSHLISLLKENTDNPAIITDLFVDDFLQQHEVNSVTRLLEKSSETIPASVSVKYSDKPSLPATSQIYPVSVLFLICEDGFSIRDKLVKTKLLLKRMDVTGIERAEEKNLYPKKSLIVVWLVNESIFDDKDWPGGSSGMNATELRQARKEHAVKWLEKEGVSLITITNT